MHLDPSASMPRFHGMMSPQLHAANLCYHSFHCRAAMPPKHSASSINRECQVRLTTQDSTLYLHIHAWLPTCIAYLIEIPCVFARIYTTHVGKYPIPYVLADNQN